MMRRFGGGDGKGGWIGYSIDAGLCHLLPSTVSALGHVSNAPVEPSLGRPTQGPYSDAQVHAKLQSLVSWQRRVKNYTVPRSGCEIFSEDDFRFNGIDVNTLVTLTIQSGVTSIAPNGVSSCHNLEAVSLPTSLIEIGHHAFSNSHLLRVTIPAGVTRIGDSAFAFCKAMRCVTMGGAIQSIGEDAFKSCRVLRHATFPLDSVVSIGRGAFHQCDSLLTLDLGAATDVDAPNRFPEINGVNRSATLLHKLPGGTDRCVVRRKWNGSQDQLPDRGWRFDIPTYEGTQPGLPYLVDGSGILLPLQLQTLAGDEYMVYGCWGKDPVAHPDFKRLAAEQHPAALGELGSWGVLVHNTDVATDTLDLVQYGNELVRGQVNLNEPVLVVWV